MDSQKVIETAKTAGFCWGVKRAMDMTLETANKSDGRVYTHGPLIHNPQVIEMLESKNVYAVDDATGLKEGRVIIRTHGVTPQVRRKLKSQGLSVSDATCPLVARVQGIIKKHASRGFSVVIIGDKGHAEVIGLTGFASGACHVVGSRDEAESLPPMDKVCVVAQTTCDTERYGGVIDILQARYPSAVVFDTICEATRLRQQEARDLASRVDLMVVVGGRNSANTNRLAQLARSAGAATVLIESEEELDPEIVGMHSRIGLTAGASTPSWMIQRVRHSLEGMMDDGPKSLGETLKGAMSALVIGNVSVAAGAALMVFANAALAGYAFTWTSAFLAASYIFSMYALNQLNDVGAFRHNEPKKIRFYLKRKKSIEIAAITFTALSLAAALALGLKVSLVYIAALALGLAYTVKWMPDNEWIRIHRLKDIPASKDLFVGLAWSVVAVLIPSLAAGARTFSASVTVAGLFMFTLVYIRSVLSDIRDIHGDRLVGRETIPILIGKTPTKIFLATLTLALAGLLAGATAAGWVTSFGYLALLSVAYTATYLWLYNKRIISRGVRFDLAIDGVFHFTGLLALLWVLYPVF